MEWLVLSAAGDHCVGADKNKKKTAALKGAAAKTKALRRGNAST